MPLPKTYKRLVIQKLTPRFREAVKVGVEPLVEPGPQEILIKNRYVGINADDVNTSAGRYEHEIGDGAGMEGVGEVVLVGSKVDNFKVGDFVGYFTMNIPVFAEYITVPASIAIPIPSDPKPEHVSLLISGMTASIGLDKVGNIKKGEKVLITAAAGALGQIAVQYCKSAGCYVIGLTSTNEKREIVKDLGCDDIINYKEEDLDQVLSEKYPSGIDVIWETIGGTVFDILFKHLAVHGRLVILGYITQYLNENINLNVGTADIPSQLLSKSASIRGFYLPYFSADMPHYFKRLLGCFEQGLLKLALDDTSTAEGGAFKGLDGCIRGIEYLHSGKSTGKVFVTME